MKKISGIVVATALLGASSMAFAQAPAAWATPQLPWYIGAGVGQGSLNRSASELTGLTNAVLDDTDTTYTVRGGLRFSPFFAVELGYYDLGKYDFNGTAAGTNVYVNGSARAQSYGISLVGIVPISAFDLYGRIGYARSEIKFKGNLPEATADRHDKQNEATYGVGARWKFHPNWGLFAEWMKNDKIRVDSYMGGIDFRF